jgi:hypothetical protein
MADSHLEGIDRASLLWDETIPGGAYWTRVLRRGHTLRLVDVEGGSGVSCLCYNADDTSERYNAADTVKIQNSIFPSQGQVLYSDMGRVLLSITQDTNGNHDLLGGCSDARSNQAKYGRGTYQDLRNGFLRNARDNFVVALGRHGLGKRDVVPNLNFFARVRVGADGGLSYVEGSARAGSFVDLRAEMNVLVVLSNTPHVLSPGRSYDPKPLRLIVWRAPAPAADDPCRTGSAEARRGFRNTDELFLGSATGEVLP